MKVLWPERHHALNKQLRLGKSSVWHAAAGCWFFDALLNIWRLPTVFYAVYDEKTEKCLQTLFISTRVVDDD